MLRLVSGTEDGQEEWGVRIRNGSERTSESNPIEKEAYDYTRKRVLALFSRMLDQEQRDLMKSILHLQQDALH